LCWLITEFIIIPLWWCKYLIISSDVFGKIPIY
jgi:hypothetical protein